MVCRVCCCRERERESICVYVCACTCARVHVRRARDNRLLYAVPRTLDFSNEFDSLDRRLREYRRAR